MHGKIWCVWTENLQLKTDEFVHIHPWEFHERSFFIPKLCTIKVMNVKVFFQCISWNIISPLYSILEELKQASKIIADKVRKVIGQDTNQINLKFISPIINCTLTQCHTTSKYRRQQQQQFHHTNTFYASKYNKPSAMYICHIYLEISVNIFQIRIQVESK